MRPPETRAAARRIAILRGVLIALFLALAARAAHLTIASDAGHRATSQFVGMMEIQGARGGIYDRHYRELALTVRAPSVYAFPGQLASAGEQSSQEDGGDQAEFSLAHAPHDHLASAESISWARFLTPPGAAASSLNDL